MSYQTFVEELFNNPSVLEKLQSFYRNDEWSVTTTQKLLKHAVLDVLTTDKAQTKDGGEYQRVNKINKAQIIVCSTNTSFIV